MLPDRCGQLPCGDIEHLLPFLADLSIDILDVDHMVDLQKSYEVLGPDVIRCGNIDPVFVQDRTAREVEDASRVLVEQEKNRIINLQDGWMVSSNSEVSPCRM